MGNSNLKLYFKNYKIGNVNKKVDEIQKSFGIGIKYIFQNNEINFWQMFSKQIIEKNKSCPIEAVFTFLKLAWNSKTFLSLWKNSFLTSLVHFWLFKKFKLAFNWAATVINCNTTVITFILIFFITQSFCVNLEWRYNLGIKVLLWNGSNFFVDNTELRFYLRMAVNYRGNLFDNIGSRSSNKTKLLISLN